MNFEMLPCDYDAEPVDDARGGPGTLVLTQRQREILRAIIWGYRSDEIGRWLNISHRTVEIHRSRLYLKMNARNTADAVRIALAAGFEYRPDPLQEAAGVDSDRSRNRPMLGSAGWRQGADEAIDDPFWGDGWGDASSSKSAARVIGFDDADYAIRLNWISAWVRVEQDYIYNPWQTQHLSQAKSSFDIIVLHGKDVRRLVQLMREVRQIYTNKIVVILVSRATSTERAALYRSGADSVQSLDSDFRVAAAWLSSALARQGVNADSDLAAQQLLNVSGLAPTASLVSMIGDKALTYFEREALNLLEFRLDQPVTYNQLLRIMRRARSENSVRALQTAICHLNRKLEKCPRIENVRGEGYILRSSALAASRSYWSERCVSEQIGGASRLLPPSGMTRRGGAKAAL